MSRGVVSRRSSSGFSLLETIVTLVVVSLIVVVLMQALQQALSLRTRLLRHERETRMASLQEQWFRDSVSAAVADLPDAFGRMDGTATSLELVSAAPLSGRGLGRIRWTLQPVDGGYALSYGDSDWQQLQVIRGPLRDASFAYLDAQGKWQDEWKPGGEASLAGKAAAGKATVVHKAPVFDEAPRAVVVPAGEARAIGGDVGDALPRMVRLQAITATGELTWLVPILATSELPPFLRPQELGNGR